MKQSNKKRHLKMWSITVLNLFCATFCAGILAGCGSVTVDSIEIIEPTNAEVRVGETFSLDYNVVPEKAKENTKIKWEIDDRRLSFKNDAFEALSCGTVKVTASVSGSEATDEIELQVVPPEGYTLHNGGGYSVVLPSSFRENITGNSHSWLSTSYQYFNFVITEEELNESYFNATASMFQSTYETMFSLMGMKVEFVEPVAVKKETYLGFKRVVVESVLDMTIGQEKSRIYQTQVIFNNVEKNLSCGITVTCNEKEYDDSIKEIRKFVLSQFLPS